MKSDIAVIVVLIDLFIAYFFYFAIISARVFQKAVNKDINGKIVQAQDFTAVIKVPAYREDFKNLKPIFWKWASNVNEKDTAEYYIRSKDNAKTSGIDHNCNNVFNVNFGRNNLGHLDYIEKINDIDKSIEKKKV